MDKDETGRFMNRQTWRDWLWLALLGLLVQAFWAWRIQHPTYFDAYYYTVNAQQIAQGEGLTEPVIWQYLDEPESIPKPSFTYWMPLTSFLGALGYRLVDSFRGAQLPFWLLAGLLPLLSYSISWRFSPARWQARTAALFTMAGGYYAAYWVQPSTFVFFAWVGAGCLLAIAWAQERQRWGFWFLAGLLAGAAHLTRADGLLLLGVGGLIWLWSGREIFRARRHSQKEFPLARSSYAGWIINGGLLMAGYLLVMGWWFYRTWLLTGRALSPVGAETVFLTTYDDIFAFNRHFDLQGYLAWGWSNILQSKLEASWLSLQTFVGVVGITGFSLFVIIGWWRLGRDRPEPERYVLRTFLRPYTLLAILLFVVMSLVFTFPGQRGSLLHSSTALWPWSMALAAAGTGYMVDWFAARRRNWKPAGARLFFAITFTILIFFITFIVSGSQPLSVEEGQLYHQIGRDLPAGSVVMVGSPADFYYHTGLPALVVPNEDPAGMWAAAQKFNATHLILTADSPRPLRDLYSGVEFYAVEPVREYAEGVRLFRFIED
jgi:hypothetical protein